MHVFREKVQKLEKIIFGKFSRNFWLLNEFPELKINEKHRKTSKPKSGKFARFFEKIRARFTRQKGSQKIDF